MDYHAWDHTYWENPRSGGYAVADGFYLGEEYVAFIYPMFSFMTLRCGGCLNKLECVRPGDAAYISSYQAYQPSDTRKLIAEPSDAVGFIKNATPPNSKNTCYDRRDSALYDCLARKCINIRSIISTTLRLPPSSRTPCHGLMPLPTA